MGNQLSDEELHWLSRVSGPLLVRPPRDITERLLTLGLVDAQSGRLVWTPAGQQAVLEAIRGT